MLNPFIELFGQIIFLINLVLIAWIVLGLLIQFDIVNRHSPIVSKVYATLGLILEPMLRRIRRVLGRFLPAMGGLDLSPIALFLLLHFIKSALFHWFYTI